MYYLMSQFSGWLLVAFVVGLFVGYLTCSRTGSGRWGWLPVGLLVAVGALMLTSLRFVNGMPALWIETAALFFVFYLVGCCFGCIIRRAFTDLPQTSGVQGWHTNQGDLAPPLGAAPLVAAGLHGVGVREWHKDLGAGGGASAPVPAAMPAASADQAVIAAPAGSVVMPKVEGEDMIAGNRPLGLAGPRGGRPDDLKLIRGIGKQNEGRLHGLGIWHFDQIASWTEANALWVGSYLAFPGRIEREEWIAQATDLAAGKDTAFAARVKRGEVSTSRDDGTMGQGNVTPTGGAGTGKNGSGSA